MYNVHVNQRKTEPEDYWSYIAHLSAEDMLKSAVIEEKKFKHSPGPLGKGRQPIRAKILIWCQQVGLITMVICCKFFNLWRLYTSFHDLINVYSRRSGADNHRGWNFYDNRNLLPFRSFATSLNKISLKSDFIQFFSWFYTCIKPLGDKILMSTGTSCHFGHLLQV